MIKTIRISVAMATYNGARFLREQLESIAMQTRLPDELIIVDDCSNDDTMNIANEFYGSAPFTVKILRNEQTLGITKNFEKAAVHCTGDVIAFSDQDDVWLPNKLSLMENIFSRDEGIGMVFSDAQVVDEKLRNLGYKLWDQSRFYPNMRKRIEQGRSFEVILQYDVVTGATMAFRTNYLDMLLPFPECWIHDGWVALMMASLAKVKIIQQPLMLYRQHQMNMIGGKNIGVLKTLQVARRKKLKFFNMDSIRYKVAFNHIISRSLPVHIDPNIILGKIKHFQFRGELPENRLFRIIPVINEFALWRYSRFSRGYRSALRDLYV